MATLTKHPSEAIRVVIDWAPYTTAAATTITTSTWTDVFSSGMILTGASIYISDTFIMVSGGIDGDIGSLQNLVVFADGTQRVFDIIVSIVGRVPPDAP